MARIRYSRPFFSTRRSTKRIPWRCDQSASPGVNQFDKSTPMDRTRMRLVSIPSCTQCSFIASLTTVTASARRNTQRLRRLRMGPFNANRSPPWEVIITLGCFPHGLSRLTSNGQKSLRNNQWAWITSYSWRLCNRAIENNCDSMKKETKPYLMGCRLKFVRMPPL